MTSAGAKGGFSNEKELIELFNDFDSEIFPIVDAMGYDISQVSKFEATKAPARVKPDVILKVFSRDGTLLGTEALSAKLQSSIKGFNQVDRGDVEKRYRSLWPEMSDEAAAGLKLFTGFTAPTGTSRNPKRMFMDELPRSMKDAIIGFFEDNLEKVIEDVLAGRAPMKANWLAVSEPGSIRVNAVPMKEVVQAASKGGVGLTERFSLRIGMLTAQRKGGDGGAESAKNLQFKVNPSQLLREVLGV
jgi:hypothetical protein